MRVLGVDGGGTKTRLVLADGRGSILGATVAASINLDDHSMDHAVGVLRAALAELVPRDPAEGLSVDAAYFCLGGVLDDADRRSVRDAAVSAGVAQPESIGVHHDAYGALVGGLAGREGMLVVAGTGSICFGRTTEGREARCGNWGPRIGDEGSGYWLGREALRAVARASDGRGRATALTADVLAALAIDHPDALLRRIHRPDMDRTRTADLAPLVLGHAAEGDRVAGQIVERGCRLLAECVEVVDGELFGSADVELTTTGGLTRNATYLRALETQVARRVPHVRIVAPALPPVLGAVRLALERAGRNVTAEVDARLASERRMLSDAF